MECEVDSGLTDAAPFELCCTLASVAKLASNSLMSQGRMKREEVSTENLLGPWSWETESSVSLVLKPGCRRKAANSCSVMQTWLLLKDPVSFLASRDIYHLHVPMREVVRQTTKMELGKGWLLQEGKPASVFFRYIKVWFAAWSNFFHFFNCINFFLHIYVANI